MLSNTATPIYYAQFRDDVLAGRIPVNKYISLEMNRIDGLIADPKYYYDDKAVEGFIAYCEKELTLPDGSDLYLLDSFKLWAEQLFGWYYYIDRSVYKRHPDGTGEWVNKKIKKRLINEQYIITARGSAKSMYASCIQSFFLNIDLSATDQVVTAPTMRQADETLAPMRVSIIRRRGPYTKFLTEGSIQNTTGNIANRVKLASTKKGIQNFMNGSIVEVRPMDVDALQGLRCRIVTVDEWLSGDTRQNVFEALSQGASKFDDWIVVGTSSEGTVRGGIGDTIKMGLLDVLNGKISNPHMSIWYYCLDDIMEVGDPSMWIKANPNIGKTVTYEVYQIDVEKAELNSSIRNDILAKRFGIPVEGFQYFFSYEETKPTARMVKCNGMNCALGIDLSQGDDFCAFTFLFPLKGGKFAVKTRSYISSLTYEKLPRARREKYDTFIQEGSLIVLDGVVLNLDDVYYDLDKHIAEMNYDVSAVGYDPYNAKEFIAKWANENGPFGIEKVIQGAKTESVPLGEIKSLSESRYFMFDEDLMSFSMQNAIIKLDNNNNKKLSKMKREDKIDNVAALMDAFVAYKRNLDAFE